MGIKMPELPEVEVVRQVLEGQLKGHTIESLECFYPPLFQNDLEDFSNKVCGQKIIAIKRRAKYLVFCLEEGFFLSHLRMEGKYFYLDEGSEVSPYVHLIFHLDKNKMLCYSDVRKFGRLAYRTKDTLYTTAPLSLLGPEANESLNPEEIWSKIKEKQQHIKTILLDQTILSGLGNIYADEVLFVAGIDPLKKGYKITLDETKRLCLACEAILTQAILKKGTTIRSYTSSLGVEGSYQEELKVHTKQICPSCHQQLVKVKINGRTTYYCSACQR